MQISVRKWGNNPAIRIPAAVMAAAGLRIDAKVEIRVDETGAVVLARADFDLDTALTAITPDNLHDETDFGAGVGNEAW